MKLSQFASRMWYYILIATIFLVLAFVFSLLPQFGLISPNLASDLAVEYWGISATVLLLIFAVEHREYSQWRPVKDKVMKTIGREIYELFIDFTNVCVCTHGGGKSREESLKGSDGITEN